MNTYNTANGIIREFVFTTTDGDHAKRAKSIIDSTETFLNLDVLIVYRFNTYMISITTDDTQASDIELSEILTHIFISAI